MVVKGGKAKPKATKITRKPENTKLKAKYHDHQTKLKAYEGISCIYVLRFDYPDRKLYKVGLAKNMAHRMRAYSTHNAIPPVIEDFFVIHDSSLLGVIEKSVHTALRSHLVRTEYFDCDLDLIKRTVRSVSELVAGEDYVGWSLEKPMLMDYAYWAFKRGVLAVGDGLLKGLKKCRVVLSNGTE